MLNYFEKIVRKASRFTEEPLELNGMSHPFEGRAIFERLPVKVKTLFDDSHYAEATFEAFKFLDRSVAMASGLSESGHKLMMAAFAEKGPIRLNSFITESEKDEQKGFQFMLAGSMAAIRNPRGHEFDQLDSAEACLDHLSSVSMFLRRLQEAGYLPDN